jgi:hypothetical protein
MTISSETNTQLKSNSDNNKLEFQNIDEIYFPHICIVCRNFSDKYITKNIYGFYALNKDYKKNYTFSLPVCDSCKKNIEMKTGLPSKSGKLILMSFIFGTITAILLFLTFNSLLLSVSIIAISIMFPAWNYKIKTKSKIKLDNHLKINVNPKNSDIVELEFSDKEYAKVLEDINLSRIKLKQEQEAKLKQEQEAKLKKEHEAKLKKEHEAKLKQEHEVKLKEEHEAKLKQEQEVKLKQEQEVKLNQEQEAKLNQELEDRKILQQIPDSTKLQQNDENLENEKSPMEITITKPISGENKSKEQRIKCPNCKMEINSEYRFCNNCGISLNQQSK